MKKMLSLIGGVAFLTLLIPVGQHASASECNKACWRAPTLKACMQCAAQYGHGPNASLPWCKSTMKACSARVQSSQRIHR